MPYLSASAVVIHYEEALYQVHAPLPLCNSNFVFNFVFTLFDFNKCHYLEIWVRGHFKVIESQTIRKIVYGFLSY